jgi:6-phosphogluconolactonase (cycloisomerase 2 family)
MHSVRRNGIALIGTFLLLPILLADDDRAGDHSPKNVLYVHSNNPVTEKNSEPNSVLAYTRDPVSGTLTEIKGSPFLTGGSGYLNSPERLGPDDTDQQITATADHRFLYVVNEGSNTIAGFSIQSDGSLKAVKGSPFPSGGVRPVSIGIHGNLMIVANQGDQLPGGTGGTHAPTYASFRIEGEGTLHALQGPQPPQVPGSSPTQALFSPDGKLLFDANFSETPFNNTGFPPFIPAFSTQLHSYKVNHHGHLTAASQIAPPQPPFILGLQVHSQKNILYAGFVLSNVLGTYSYDEDGVMTLEQTLPGAQGTGKGMCWVAISKDLKNIYTSDAVTDQIDVFSIAADPLKPTWIQNVALAGPKTPLSMQDFFVTASLYDTTPFQLQTSPDGEFLYVLNHEESVPPSVDTTGNALHILKRAADGRLTEIPTSPLIFSAAEVANNAHPLGVLVF